MGLRTGIQLPVIIRKGKLTANASIGKVTYENGEIKIQLKRDGNRSIFGDLEILQNGESLGKAKGVAVFVESPTAIYGIKTNKLNKTQPLEIRFIESENSGDISISKTITL